MIKRKKRKFSGLPHNLNFWIYTLKRPEEVNDFLVRGNQRQKNDIKHVVIYLKRNNEELFEEINGKEILRRLK